MSITVPLYGFGGGGGGAALDLKIIPGLARPANPTPNMIWVKTDKDITGYALLAEKPENPTEGLLWLGISDSSEIKATVPVGKEYITLYFLTGAIYTSAAWTDVPVMSYQNGEWVDWISNNIFIKDGVFYREYGIQGSLSVSENKVSYAGGTKNHYFMYWKTDVTNYTSLKYKVDTTSIGSYNGINVGLIKSLTIIDDFVAWARVSDSPGLKNDSIPISSYDGEYYVAICVQSGSGASAGSFTLHDLELL